MNFWTLLKMTPVLVHLLILAVTQVKLCSLIVVKPSKDDGSASARSYHVEPPPPPRRTAWKYTTEGTNYVPELYQHQPHQKWTTTAESPSEKLPYFEDDELYANVTAQLGHDVYLHCRVNDLHDKTVSWVKRRGQSFELLTFGHMTYSSEDRYSLSYAEPNDWRLLVQSAKPKDSGVYECQVSSHPPLARCTNLIVLVPVVEIVDDKDRPVAERFYQRGTTIELSCAASETFNQRVGPASRASKLVWLHGSRPLNHDTTRGGISVRTEPVLGGTLSRLSVAGARRSDAGVYSCVVGEARASVLVHVLAGEHADAMHYGRAGGAPAPGALMTVVVHLACCYFASR